jgi:hypothetical protein
MPTRPAATTTNLAHAPKLISFGLSSEDTNAHAAGVSPPSSSYGVRRGGRQATPALQRKQFPQHPGSPQNTSFAPQPLEKNMSKLIRRTKRNFGAALLIALQNTHSKIGRLADTSVRLSTAATLP